MFLTTFVNNFLSRPKVDYYRRCNCCIFVRQMPKKHRSYPFPWLTLALSSISIAYYMAYVYLTKEIDGDYEVYNMLGAPSSIEIYQGQYWGLFLNSFIHNRLDFLIINLCGLWVMGAFTERRIGFIRFFLLGLVASISTSLIQMTWINDPGIGLSGVNFFLFVYLFVRSIKNIEFQLKFPYFFLIILILIAFGSLYARFIEGWNIGVESIFAGIIIGSFFGLLARIPSPWFRVPLYLITTFVLLIPFVYAPWASDWHIYKGMEAHLKHDRAKASFHYKRALEIEPENHNAVNNLQSIRIDELSDKAFNLHNRGEYEKARIYYEEIIQLDPSNQWAKEQLRKLP